MAQRWILALCGVLVACGATQEQTPPAIPATAHGTLSANTSDGVEVHGYIRPSTAANSQLPTVLLFHQGGANAQGEYGEIQNWLAFEGITSIAWDSRAGGSMFENENRTVQNLAEGTPAEFCDALPDLLAAIDEASRHGFGENGFVLWGSSYTGALVFHAAAERPDLIRGVLAFSPASGAPMEGCRAMVRAPQVQTEILIVQPEEEVVRPTAAEQRLALEALGASYIIVRGGAHGSSTLLDERTGGDMRGERARVIGWLQRR